MSWERLAFYDEIFDRPLDFSEKTDTYSVLSSDIGKCIYLNSSSDKTFTLFNATDSNLFYRRIRFETVGTGVLTIKPYTGGTINGLQNLISKHQYAWVELMLVASNTWIVYSNSKKQSDYYFGSWHLLPDPYSGYSYVQEVRIDKNKIYGTTNLTNYVLTFNSILDNLKTTGNGGYVTDDNGYDIIFTDSDGTTQLDHEIERYNGSTGEFITHVRIPTVSYNKDTVIYIHYGNSGVSSSQEDITGTWDSNYIGVWHLKELNGTDVTEWKSPGTCSSETRDTDNIAWSNPSYAQSSDDSRAISDLGGPGAAPEDYSEWLRCVNFNFNINDIPENSTIIGIEVQIERQGEGSGDIEDEEIYLRKTSGQVGDNKAAAGTWPTSDGTATYGGSSDDWNASLLDTDIRNSNFGIDICATATPFNSGEARIDHVQIRVYYSVTSLMYDSTTNDNDGTPSGIERQDVQIGAGQDFTGATPDYIQVSGLMGSQTKLTLEAWVDLDSIDTNGAEVISIGDCVNLRLDDTTSGLLGSFYDGTDWDAITAYNTSLVGTGVHQVVYMVDTVVNTQLLMLDGIVVAQSSHTESISYSGLGSNTQIGRHGDGGTLWDFDGRIDEVRVSNIARPVDQMRTQYYNQKYPTNFYRVS